MNAINASAFDVPVCIYQTSSRPARVGLWRPTRSGRADGHEGDEQLNPRKKPMSLPGMTAFISRFPEVAKRETRVLETRYPRDGLPAGSYGYLELYCADPTCDCRRVLLQVRAEAQPKTVLATINYGWESVAFYTQLLPGYPKLVRQLKQASLDPLIPQSRFAPLFLRLFQTVVLQDRAYIQRLQRHYAMFKQHLAQEPPVSSANDR